MKNLSTTFLLLFFFIISCTEDDKISKIEGLYLGSSTTVQTGHSPIHDDEGNIIDLEPYTSTSTSEMDSIEIIADLNNDSIFFISGISLPFTSFTTGEREFVLNDSLIFNSWNSVPGYQDESISIDLSLENTLKLSYSETTKTSDRPSTMKTIEFSGTK